MYKFLLGFLFFTIFSTNSHTLPSIKNVTNFKSSITKDALITGKIIDKETKKPLEYATIAFFSIKKNKIIAGGITNSKGEFSIPVATGVYNISIEYISFKTLTIENKTISNDENLGLFSLEVDLETLGDIEIIAERTTVEIKLDKKIYNVGKDLSVSGGTVSDVLDNVPSVSVDGEGNVALRGNNNVRILINGKPSGLVGLNSTNALKQLPAESIEKVEVITSPSARYEAEGTAGILNIILRRSKLQGLNGAITANIGHPDRAGISGNINYRTGDFNFFNTTSYQYTETVGHWYNDVKFFDINTPDLSERRHWTDTRKGITTNTGVEWYINDLASVTASIVYNNNDNEDNSINNLTQFNKIDNITSNSIRLDPGKGGNKNIQYAINFTQNFKTSGQKLTFDFQYEDNDSNQNSRIVSDINENTENIENQTNTLLQADYIHPIGEHAQFETGYRGDFSERITDFRVEIFNPNTNAFELNKNLTNLFKFRQYINAVYTQYGSKLGKFSYLLGLRLENTRITLDQPTTGDFSKKNLTGLFPTINLNYEIDDNESLMFGFNRRLRRPRNFMLNPFPSRSSLTNLFQGNPDLNPTYSSKFEIGYLNRFGNLTISSAIYYQHSIEVITFVSKETGEIVTINGEDIPVIQRGPVNLATDERYGLELNANYNPTKKWRVNTDLNFYQLKRNGVFNGQDFGADNFTWSARLTNKLTIPWDVDWQTNLNYRAPTQDTQNNRKARFSANLAFSKDLFKDNASLAFNVRDVLNSVLFENQIITDEFITDQEVQFRGGRTYNLSFTYRFNQKKKRERNRNFRGGSVDM